MTELIAALDVDSQDDALDAVYQCAGCAWFKVGLQLFIRCGPPVVEAIVQRNRRVFLDLKIHDIPNTAHHAARAAAGLGAGMLTVHAAGGKAMIAAAREGAEGTDARILAVTVLTSIDEAALREEIGMPESPRDAVVRLARLAIEAGAHGVVASPQEIEPLREALGPEVLIVTPGIRPEWADAGDQARIATPGAAAAAGATHIVVGRPILQHAQPAEAVGRIKAELAAAGGR